MNRKGRSIRADLPSEEIEDAPRQLILPGWEPAPVFENAPGVVDVDAAQSDAKDKETSVFDLPLEPPRLVVPTLLKFGVVDLQDLLALSEEQMRAARGVGKKKISAILAFQEQARALVGGEVVAGSSARSLKPYEDQERSTQGASSSSLGVSGGEPEGVVVLGSDPATGSDAEDTEVSPSALLAAPEEAEAGLAEPTPTIVSARLQAEEAQPETLAELVAGVWERLDAGVRDQMEQACRGHQGGALPDACKQALEAQKLLWGDAPFRHLYPMMAELDFSGDLLHRSALARWLPEEELWRVLVVSAWVEPSLRVWGGCFLTTLRSQELQRRLDRLFSGLSGFGEDALNLKTLEIAVRALSWSLEGEALRDLLKAAWNVSVSDEGIFHMRDARREEKTEPIAAQADPVEQALMQSLEKGELRLSGLDDFIRWLHEEGRVPPLGFGVLREKIASLASSRIFLGEFVLLGGAVPQKPWGKEVFEALDPWERVFHQMTEDLSERALSQEDLKTLISFLMHAGRLIDAHRAIQGATFPGREALMLELTERIASFLSPPR